MLTRNFALVIVLLFPLFGLSQKQKPSADFTYVDSLARAIEFKTDIYQVTNDLTKSFTDPLLKYRAIFIWITDNISYDYPFFNSGKEIKPPECKPGIDCKRLFADWENAYLKRVIKKGRGICDGYARVFKKMCDIAGLPSEIVSGYTKTKPYQVGNSGSVNHAWNVIMLDSTYYMLDATWAAGYCDEDEDTGLLKSFIKDFNEYYWLTPFNDFARNHYPKDAKWVLEANYTREKFAANPYYASGVIENIQLITPGSGVIHARKGDTLRFKMEYSGIIECLQVNSNIFRSLPLWRWEKISKGRSGWVYDPLAIRRQHYTTFKKEGNVYEFAYPVTDNSLYYVEVLFNYQRAMRFKVIVDKGE